MKCENVHSSNDIQFGNVAISLSASQNVIQCMPTDNILALLCFCRHKEHLRTNYRSGNIIISLRLQSLFVVLLSYPVSSLNFFVLWPPSHFSRSTFCGSVQVGRGARK
ncbi:hypothetical protein CDL12_00869 [Handroanthus impetiginosus]|uniref:Uncharacterized protein n=1 Tax=Handroanthus impetiginosus TaxID=429701 RepID=A0A2G9I9E9_9LAMI|nr:hypothetical protein CDL12_00869 [Handroanthus impetiginosus]